jgi:multiple sugar transport system substrate-binding protein
MHLTMPKTVLVLCSAAAIAVSACGSSAATPTTPTSTQPASSGAPTSAPTSAPTAAQPSGSVVLSGWQSSPAEGNALTQTLLAFQAAYPNIKVDYQPIAGDYPTVMTAKFASKDVPDVMYLNADVAPDWIKAGFFAPLDSYIAASSYDVSKFYAGYASIFKGTDGKTYGFPKDGNTIGMAYNTALVPTPPTTIDQLVTLAQSLKGKNGLKAPICLNAGLDRGLAWVYAQGGTLLSADGKTETIDSAASVAAVQSYLDLFKNGLGMTASDMGAGWCGDALGKVTSAITFEGGWLDPAMSSTYPTVKYAWAPFPTGSSGSPVTISYTAAYAIPADAKNKDAAWVLLSWLTGKDGMTKWTQGGVALPARSDVAAPAGKDVLTAMSAVAKPGSGFVFGYAAIQKAFQDEVTKQIAKGGAFSAAAVCKATAAAIKTAIGG